MNDVTNDCECNDGFDGQDLDGSLKFCKITCDNKSTKKDSATNTCPCIEGFISSTLDSSGE